jgi:hypothetical protein
MKGHRTKETGRVTDAEVNEAAEIMIRFLQRELPIRVAGPAYTVVCRYLHQRNARTRSLRRMFRLIDRLDRQEESQRRTRAGGPRTGAERRS